MCESETLKMNPEMKNEIFDDALKFVLKKQLKEYNLDERRVECIITNIVYDWNCITPKKDLPLPKPDEVYLSYMENNGKYQFKLEITAYNEDGEALELEVELFCDKEDVLLDFAVEYLREDDGLFYINPINILNNLKARYRTHTETIITSNEPDPDDPDEEIPLYDTTDCPVCMETFDEHNKRNTYCGHPICYGCFHHIINSNKTDCPICRADYEEFDVVIETETRELDVDDIQELQENQTAENIHKLIRMVNIDDLAVDIVGTDGYEGIMGFEYENWDDGLYVFASYHN